ncbi:DnaJ domain-containing protein [Nocardioides sp. BYT-33-1]|uniref:DnaJ domain-containing protein n=1 Tax=Nocardioides sp. BYT-33-1 TaxID=3416952 RepID=UPI003F52955D
MSTNLYDLLDVEESATEDEIRAAWKAAIADLDPTERRFRAYSDAAGVLLDPAKRAAYDAELAAARAAEAEAETALEDEPGRENSRWDEEASSSQREFHRPAGETHAASPAAPRRTPGTVALVVAGVAAVLAVGLAVTLALLPGARGELSAKELAERNLRFERTSVEVENAAERIVGPAFSYGYQTMAADLERVTQYLSPELAAKQTKLWPELTDEATKQKIVVEAAADGVALTRLSDDGEVATVVVFIRQDSVRDGGERSTLRMWATLQLVRDSGSEQGWLLDDICVDSDCG